MTVADPVVAANAALARYLVASATLGETLQWMADLALSTVEPADGVGLTLLEGRRRPVTVYASNPTLSLRLDQAQYAEDTGPCLEAYRRRTVIRVGDIARASEHWPGFAAAAVEDGVASSLSVPLVAEEEGYGVLNLYARTAAAFDEADVDSTQIFADQASVVLANASAYWDARDLANGLGEAMKTRAVIDMAKGKLMASGRYTPDEAFQVLVNASQRTNTRLRDIAYRMVHNTDPTQPSPTQPDADRRPAERPA